MMHYAACAESYSRRTRYTGKERDTESGLGEFGARYYGSSLGRFMTPDWAAKPTDVPYASFGNPQSLNLYSYVNNNPTTTRDPDGHCCDPDTVIMGITTIGGSIVGGIVGAAAGAGGGTLVAPGVGTVGGGFEGGVLGAAAGGTTGAALGNAIIGTIHYLSDSKTAPATPTPATGQGQQTAPATAPAGQQVPVQAPGFVGDAGGNVVAIPPGSTARPADNGNGVVYQPPVGAGEHPDANAVRVMGPSTNQPTGSITVHGPTGQPINPSTGKPDTRANTHTPIKPTPNN
jgi:RHS repeat-associated protein